MPKYDKQTIIRMLVILFRCKMRQRLEQVQGGPMALILFGFAKHSKSVASAIGSQAPYKPTGFNFNPFWTLHAMAAKCL